MIYKCWHGLWKTYDSIEKLQRTILIHSCWICLHPLAITVYFRPKSYLPTPPHTHSCLPYNLNVYSARMQLKTQSTNIQVYLSIYLRTKHKILLHIWEIAPLNFSLYCQSHQLINMHVICTRINRYHHLVMGYHHRVPSINSNGLTVHEMCCLQLQTQASHTTHILFTHILYAN